MNPIETTQREIERGVPSVWTRLRRPRAQNGMWWLDAKHDDHVVTVQWSPRRGFGVSASLLSDGYGEGPEEVFDEQKAVTQRVVELLRTKTNTLPPRDVVLRELRGRVGVTQEQLAERLGVQQAAVSRLERRPDITLSSLRRYVAALGAELEISIRTPAGEEVKLSGPGAVNERAACKHLVTEHSNAATPPSEYDEECRKWLNTLDSITRTKWPLSAPKLSIRPAASPCLAVGKLSEGWISVDYSQAWRLSQRVIEDGSNPRDGDSHAEVFSSVLRHLLAHEIGHFVGEAAFCDHESFSTLEHPELQADAIAGWLGAQTGVGVRLGSLISKQLGCETGGCTHPPPEERSLAYLLGHVEGTREASLSARLNMVVIRVGDLERSRAFYSHLGLNLLPEKHGNGPLHYSCTMLGTLIELYPCRPNQSRSDLRLGLRVPDPAAAIDALASSGFIGEPPRVVERQHSPDVCMVRDPDGNTVELEWPPKRARDVPGVSVAKPNQRESNRVDQRSRLDRDRCINTIDPQAAQFRKTYRRER